MGVLHRDIKPDNFLLTESTTPNGRFGVPQQQVLKLADFGLSCFYHRGEPEKEVRTGHDGLTAGWLMTHDAHSLTHIVSLTTQIVGSPYYIAPEMLKPEGYGERGARATATCPLPFMLPFLFARSRRARPSPPDSPAGPEADTWSCGVCLYHMLSGSYPFPVRARVHSFRSSTCGKSRLY